MKNGYSVVITTTDSGVTKYFFISKKWLKIILSLLILVLIVIVLLAINYSRIYYQALETAILKHRNAEIEREFAKLQEIQRNLEIAEINNKKLRVMLGIEKTPSTVEPVISEVNPRYSEKINVRVNKKENIPSLLPTMGQISRTFSPDHQGIDIAAPRFSPVVAAASGIVSATGWDSIYGNYVIIEHNVDYSTFYGHLHSIDIKREIKVKSGQVIGTVGSTGKSTSPHLHYEVRFQHKSVEPLGYLPLLLNYKE